MRRWLLIALGLVLAAAAIAAVAVIQLDRWIEANRGWVAKQAEAVIGRRVALGKVGTSLGFGIAARAEDVRVAEDPAYGEGDFLTITSLHAYLKLWPLLSGVVRVSSIEIEEPTLRVIRDARGFSVDSLGRSKKRGAKAAGRKPGSSLKRGGVAALLAALSVGRVLVHGAVVSVVDRLEKPARERVVHGFEGEFTGLALGKVAGFSMGAVVPDTDVRLAVEGHVGPVASFESADPIAFDLQARLADAGGPLVVQGTFGPTWPIPVEAVVNAEPIDLAKLGAAVPALRAAGVSGTVALRLQMAGPLDPATLPALKGAVVLDEVGLTPSHGGLPMSGLKASLRVSPDRLEIPASGFQIGEWPAEIEGTIVRASDLAGVRFEQLLVRAFGGTVVIKGGVDGRDPAIPRFDVTTATRGVDVPSLVGLVAPESARVVTGKLDADLTLVGSGTTWPQLKRSLRGGGRIDVKDGTLTEVNLVEDILGGVGGVAGLDSLVPDDAREAYPALFGHSETRFDRLGTNLQIADGRVALERTECAAHDYAITGGGGLGLDGAMDFTGSLATSTGLATDIVGRVKEARLALTDGRLVIPFRVSGQWPRVKVNADTSGLLRAVGGSLLEQGLNALLGGSKASQPAAGERAPAAGDKPKEKPVDAFKRGIEGLFRRR